jgi:hypothetical protein
LVIRPSWRVDPLEDSRGVRISRSERIDAAIDTIDLRIERGDLRQHLAEQRAQCAIECGIVTLLEHAGDAGVRAFGNLDTELPQHAARQIDARGAIALPLLARAVHELNDLLALALDRHRGYVPSTERFEQCLAIRRIGLVAAHVGSNVLRRQQRDAMPQRLQPAPEVMCRAAGFHHHMHERPIGPERDEIGTFQAQ